MIAVGALLVLFLGVALWRWKRGKAQLLDYRGLFYAGLIWLAIGLPSGMAEIWLGGLLFIAAGLAAYCWSLWYRSSRTILSSSFRYA